MGAGLYLGATEKGGGHWATELGLLGAVVGAASISKISDMLSSSQEVNFGAKAKLLQVDINDMYQENRVRAQSSAITQVAVDVVEKLLVRCAREIVTLEEATIVMGPRRRRPMSRSQPLAAIAVTSTRIPSNASEATPTAARTGHGF